MDYYCNITVLPDPEITAPALMNNLFAKLHRALVNIGVGEDGLGVSFPAHGKSLGNVLRLHGSKVKLERLMETAWLKGLRDYCKIEEIAEVPAQVSYRVVKRVQRKSAYNKRKRSVAKGWLSEPEALAKITDIDETQPPLPYADINSSSTGQHMRVYIEHLPLSETSLAGSFNSYGLSSNATIPWF